MKTEKSDFIFLKFLIAGFLSMALWHLSWEFLFRLSGFELGIVSITVTDGVIFTLACIGYGACRDFGNR